MTSISTLSFNTTTRTSLMRLQGEVNDLAQQMNNGGRLNDVGRTLGRLTGSAVSARSLGESLAEQQTSNGILDRRLKNIETGMTTMRTGAEDLANALIGVNVGTTWPVNVQQAKSGLAQMTASLNSQDSGSYIFGGIQTDTAPIDATRTAFATSTAAAHFDAFVTAANTAAGRTPLTGPTAASLVTASEMTQYLTTGFPAGGVTYKYKELFEGPTPGYAGGTNAAVTAAYTNWGDNWSNASTDTGQSRISGTETVTSLATANDPAFRKMVAGYSMLTDLNIAGLNEAARSVVLSTAATTLKTASTAITALGASVGTTRARIETANTELKRQEDIMNNTVSALEEEDTTEISTKVLNLKTQLEVAYTVTGKIQNLSLLNYL
jgi:flagellar hook-associated protein 3 FlgL